MFCEDLRITPSDLSEAESEVKGLEVGSIELRNFLRPLYLKICGEVSFGLVILQQYLPFYQKGHSF